MTRFEVGKTYFGRFTCNYDHVVRETISRRTEKSIVTAEGKRRRINVWGDREVFMSGTVVISADRPVGE